MRKLQDEMGTTIITVTHDDKMLTAADRMAWIRDGLLERVANREEIEIQVGSIKNTESPYARGKAAGAIGHQRLFTNDFAMRAISAL